MGKLISLINVTPDGFCGSELVIADAEFHEFVHGLLADTHTVGFGRNTFEMFQGIWPPMLEKEGHPASQVKMARALHDKNKTVFSSTLNSTSWHNSTITQTINAEDIDRIKRGSDKNLLTIGSPGLVATLTKMNVVDEYYFSLQPVIAGHSGVRLFDKTGLDARLPLKPAGIKQLQSGVIIIHYVKKD